MDPPGPTHGCGWLWTDPKKGLHGQRQIRRLAVTSVEKLIAAITAYIENRNRKPKPFL